MVSMEKCKNENCHGMMAGTAVALSAITLIWGAALGTCMYQKVNSIYKAAIEMQYGSQANFEAYFEARMTPEVRQQIDKGISETITQLKSQGGAADTANTTNEGNTAAQDSSAQGSQSGQLTQEEIAGFIGSTPNFADKQGNILVLSYVDFLCSYCKKLHEAETLEQLSQENEDVSVVLKSIPLFWEQSEAGAHGAYCAAQFGGAEKYYAYVEKAFSKQATSESDVIALAKEIGLDEAQFSGCLSSADTESAVSEIFPAASRKFEITGTPASVIINTKTGKYEVIPGAYPKSYFEEVIKKVRG